MSQKNIKEARIENLKLTQATRKKETCSKVYKAIEYLEKNDAKINFHTVAKQASVSVSYLYKYPEIKQYIAQIRGKQSSITPALIPNIKAISDESHNKIVNRLKERIKQLDSDLSELKRKNEALAGQIYRVHYLQEQISRQQKIIEELQNNPQQVKQQKSTSKITPISKKIKSSATKKNQNGQDDKD